MMKIEEYHFIHIPKNGGMTIRKGLKKNKVSCSAPKFHKNKNYTDSLLRVMNKEGEHHGYEHARWRDLNKRAQDKQCFAIVRNPWSRVVSRFTFARKIEGYRPKDFTLEQFLEERFVDGNKPFFWHRAVRGWYPQLDYVTDNKGNIRCDILRFEYLNKEVMNYFKLTTPLTVRNVSNGEKVKENKKLINKQDYRDFFDQTTKEIVAEWYKQDIETFGFTFDGTATKNTWSVQ